MSSDFNGSPTGAKTGAKTGIVLIPDLLPGQSPADAEMRQLVRYLQQFGLVVSQISLISLKGADEGGGSASAMIRNCEAAVQNLREKCSEVLVAGTGYGAMLALEVARQNKQGIQAIAAIEPRAWLPGLKPPFASLLSKRMRQAWLAQSAGLAGHVTGRLGPYIGPRAKSLPGVAAWFDANGPRTAARTTAISTGQLLDCLHVTLSDVKQPVVLLRSEDSDRLVVDTSILLQRKLGGRVESAVVPSLKHATSLAEPDYDAISERIARFASAVTAELATRRDNEARRQKVAAGRSNAA